MAEDEAPASPGAAAGAKGPSGNSSSKREAAVKRKRRGIVSRLWRGIFGAGDDFEKRLQHLSMEEAAVHARLKRRARSSRKMTLNVISVSVALEVVAVTYAIATTRELDLSWQLRAARVLPMFLLPGLSALIYFTLASLTKMLDNKDHKTLEKLRDERQEKINELKERTNYYMTQQLIQKYDVDPAAKAAAATVLASKLGADSGLKVYLGDKSNIGVSSGKIHDAELVQSSGLRNRKSPHATNTDEDSEVSQLADENSIEPNQRVIGHYRGPVPGDGGWLARLAALLVGEDPTQCYALICGNCHMHNGLSRKEDFQYVTYYCPHCHALNGSSQSVHGSSSTSGRDTPTSPLNQENSTDSIPRNVAGNSQSMYGSSSTSGRDTPTSPLNHENSTDSIPRNVAGSSLTAVPEQPGEDERELDVPVS